MTATQLRPRTAPEMLDAAFQLLREHTRPLFVLSAILVIPGVALGVVNALLFGDMLRPGAADPARPFAAIGRIFGVLLPVMTLLVCWFTVAFGALVAAASTAYLEGRDVDPATALRAARGRAGTLVGSGLLTWLLLLVQFLACAVLLVIVMALGMVGIMFVIPSARASTAAGVVSVVLGLVVFVLFAALGLMLAARYAALPGVVMHEPLGVTASMRRARALSRGSLRRVAGLLVLVGVMFAVASFGLFGVFYALVRSQVVAQVLASVVNVPLYALGGTIATVLYYDLRIRAEGFDIEMLAEELDALPVGTPREATP